MRQFVVLFFFFLIGKGQWWFFSLQCWGQKCLMHHVLCPGTRLRNREGDQSQPRLHALNDPEWGTEAGKHSG